MQFYFKRRALHTRNINNIMEGIYNVPISGLLSFLKYKLIRAFLNMQKFKVRCLNVNQIAYIYTLKTLGRVLVFILFFYFFTGEHTM